MLRLTLAFVMVALLSVSACEGGPPPGPGKRVDAGVADTGRDARAVDARRCRPPRGMSGTPASVSQVVALINGLPMPVTVPCFLESLDRPLDAIASRGVISLQPALGRRSPRIFLLTPQLVMTVVPEGKSGTVIEFGQYVEEARTLKAEIEFPVAAPLSAAAPYDRIRDRAGTTCRGCHSDEEPMSVDGAEGFVSSALKPINRDTIELDVVREERRSCDPTVEPFRCAVLGAFLDHGEVRTGAFPPAVLTIFN